MAKEDIVLTDPMSRLSGAGGNEKITGSFDNKYIYYFEANATTTISALSGFDAQGNVVDWKTRLNCSSMVTGQRHQLPENCYIKSGSLSGDICAWKIRADKTI